MVIAQNRTYVTQAKAAFLMLLVTPMATIPESKFLSLIQWAPGLPKTRSGKIMRRILRKVTANELDNLGDTNTLANPSVVEKLIDNRANK